LQGLVLVAEQQGMFIADASASGITAHPVAELEAATRWLFLHRSAFADLHSCLDQKVLAAGGGRLTSPVGRRHSIATFPAIHRAEVAQPLLKQPNEIIG